VRSSLPVDRDLQDVPGANPVAFRRGSGPRSGEEQQRDQAREDETSSIRAGTRLKLLLLLRCTPPTWQARGALSKYRAAGGRDYAGGREEALGHHEDVVRDQEEISPCDRA
jgi:hypothetical protein